MRRCCLIAAACALALILVAPLVGTAAAGETEDFSFAKQLRQQGKYVEAAGEFLRFADDYPQSTLRPEALFSAGECFLQAYKAQDALEAYRRFLEAYPSDERACLARFQRGKIFKALKRYREGADELLLIPDQYPACPMLDQALLDAAECLMSEGDSEQAELVLRRLIKERKESTVTARARYTLAMVLINTGRGGEADKELGDIVSRYRNSPVRALALLLMGQRALAKNDYANAEDCYRTVDKDFKEDPLAEKAVLGLIDIDTRKGDNAGVLAESQRFLARFKRSPQRLTVTQGAVTAALALKEPAAAMALVDSLKTGAAPDTTGEVSLLTARALAEAGDVSAAAAELDSMRSRHPASALLADALVLQAELRERAGAPAEAARLYERALASAADSTSRVRLYERLARLSAGQLGDTLSAIRYWKLVASADGEAGTEEALFNESVLEEERGDLAAASRGYEELIARFPDGRFVAEARERLRTVPLLPVYNAAVRRKLSGIQLESASPAVRVVETGVVLVDDAHDAARAIPQLELALGPELVMDLPDSLRTEAGYYLGKALLMRYDVAKARGGGNEADLKRGTDFLKIVAGKYAGTRWGGLADREYLDRQFPGLGPAERLAKIDEYLKTYGTGPGRWWALNRKAAFLYERARAGDRGAAATALAACNEVLAGGASSDEKKDAMLLGAALMRMQGDGAGAARSYRSFVASYSDDPRVITALYDLGETLADRKDYAGAAAAYDRCIEQAPESALAEKCMVRKADCLLGQNMFAEAAAAYDSFSTRHPTTALADEAVFREAIAKDKLGEQASVESELDALLAKQDLAPALRLRVIAWYGDWLVRHARFRKAKPLLEELVRSERTAENETLLGDASFGARDYAGALASFSDALGLAKVDSCRALADRAKAYLRVKDPVKSAADVVLLKSRCPDSKGIAGVLLERGIIEQEEGRCEDAAKTMADLRSEYPQSEQGAEALYYLSLCDLKRQDYKVAIERLERFLDEAPRSPMIAEVYFKLGTAEFGAKNLNLAANDYALAAESAKDPEVSYTAYKNLGNVYETMEKWDEAASTWQKVIELFPERKDIVETFFKLGFAYSQAGKHELAYEVYIRIPDIATNEEQQGRAHYWAGMALKSLGRYDEAIREFLLVPRLKTGGMWGVTSKLEAASCYEATGALDDATKIYKEVLASFGPNSDWGRVATEGLARIEQKRSGEPAGTKAEEPGQKKE